MLACAQCFYAAGARTIELLIETKLKLFAIKAHEGRFASTLRWGRLRRLGELACASSTDYLIAGREWRGELKIAVCFAGGSLARASENSLSLDSFFLAGARYVFICRETRTAGWGRRVLMAFSLRVTRQSNNSRASGRFPRRGRQKS